MKTDSVNKSHLPTAQATSKNLSYLLDGTRVTLISTGTCGQKEKDVIPAPLELESMSLVL